MGADKPLHRHLGLILLVGLGGALGAGVRVLVVEGLSFWVGAGAMATVLVNVSGAFGLGWLLQALVQAGRHDGHQAGPEGTNRRLLRLGLGTGFFGGFTTYSGFALDTVTLAGLSPALASGATAGTAAGLGTLGPVLSVALYLAASLVGGLAAAFLGMAVGAAVGRRGSGGSFKSADTRRSAGPLESVDPPGSVGPPRSAHADRPDDLRVAVDPPRGDA